MKSWHMLVCGALIVAGVVLVATGAGALVLLPALACAAMIGMMAWMMIRAGGGGRGEG
jgi:hypothetical protein